MIRSDVVRKELAGREGNVAESPSFGSGLYTAQWNDRTYAECLRRAESLLFAGRRVIVDASFREDHRRSEFLAAAARWQVPGVLLCCEAEPEVIRSRLASRTGDASDADWQIYLAAAAAWQPASEPACSSRHTVDTGGNREQSLAQALAALRSMGLATAGRR